MARLPTPGGDDNSWGAILNDFLSQGHNSDGSVKDTGTVAEKYVRPDSGIPKTDLSASVQASLDNADAAVAGSVPDATGSVKGKLQLAGDFAGTADTPLVAAGAITASKIANTTITDAQISGSAAVAQSKIANLMSDLAAKQSLDSDLTTIAALSPANDDVIQRKSGAWTNRTMAQMKTDLVLSKGDVGLGNVDNTSDANKPVSSAAQTALNLKADNSTAVHTTGTETIAGVKTFSSSPVVPAPSSATDAANRGYVDGAVSGISIADATASSKGLIQLAGDLGGTAAAPTVPGLAGKANTSHTHAQSDITNLTSDLSSKASTASLSSHTGATASVHGIADTSLLETASGAQTKVDTHVNDTTAAHAASAIGFTPTGGIAATDVQAAIAEVASEASGAASTLDGLSDVTISSPGTGQVLKYDGSAWVNDTDATGGGAGNGFTTITDGTGSASADQTTDTFKLRSANNKLGIAVTNDDVTHGDNALFTVNEANFSGIPQSAVTNLTTDLSAKASTASLSAHTGATTSVHGISDTSVLETTSGAQTKVDTHVNDTSAAHAASAISFAPTGSIAATDMQTALAEVASEAAAANYTNEQAQDAVGGILTDSNTIDFTYNDGANTITADTKAQMSVTSDASGLKLSGDGATPGNSKYYGTNGSGTKGFHDLPADTGETNTASNVGTAGVGLFKQKTGVNLEFKKINAGSNKVTVTDDTTFSEVDIDVNPANFTGVPQSAITGLSTSLSGKQDSDSDLTTIAALSPTNDDVIQRKGGAWANRSMAQMKTDLALAKGDVGLGNVDNTSDTNKPVGSATQTALNLKADKSTTITAGTGLSGGGDLSTNRTLAVTDNTTIQKVEIAKAGTLQGTRKRINLIEGTNVTITTADNSGSDRVDVTIASSGAPATGSITDTHVATANKDGLAGVPSMRTLGTSSTQAAAGDHLHSGQYASTLHASTHANGGSDPITQLGKWEMTPTDGTGIITFTGNNSSLEAAPTDDRLSFGSRRLAYRPLMAAHGLFGSEYLFGSPLYGPLVWGVFPGTTTSSNSLGGSKAETGTLSHPTFTEALGLRINYATAVSTNATATVASAQAQWTPGSAHTALFGGFWFHARMNFPDASYAAAGATTGQRTFIGMTDQSVANALGSDNPAGNRIGFQLINVNGGKTQTNFQVSMKDNTTETLINTGVAITQNNVYEFYLWCQPGKGNGYLFWHIWNMTADTHFDGLDATSAPAATAIMRAMAGIQTINAVARNIQIHRISVESGVS